MEELKWLQEPANLSLENLPEEVQDLKQKVRDLERSKYKNRNTLFNLIENVLSNPFELGAFSFVASYCIGKLTKNL